MDTVTYKNLLPGKEYVMTGTLMDKETGEAVVIDDKKVTAETTFTPETTEGTVDVQFTLMAAHWLEKLSLSLNLFPMKEKNLPSTPT